VLPKAFGKRWRLCELFYTEWGGQFEHQAHAQRTLTMVLPLVICIIFVMLVYLREAIQRRGGMEKIQSEEEVKEAVIEGAVHRLRPKLLTEGTTILALIPMLWATGVGAEYMRPMAAPILGGILVADEVIDIFIPILFYWERCRRLRRRLEGSSGALP